MANKRFYLLFDHVRIHGANAISSPLTYGFLSVGGFLGAVHALSRKITGPDEPIYLDGVLIASHQCDVQVYRSAPFRENVFRLTRNPLGKDGKSRPIIEEGKVHLDVSLVVEVRCSPMALYGDDEQQEAFAQQMGKMLMQQRIAGGSVLSIKTVRLFNADNNAHPIISRLMPAFVLINAQRDLMEITEQLKKENAEATHLDALIATAKLDHNPIESGKWEAKSVKRDRGWLVPIHLGYQAISPLFAPGQVKEMRDNDQSSQFVEAIYGLGKWLFAPRLTYQFDQAFWRYKSVSSPESNNDIYLFDQNPIED